MKKRILLLGATGSIGLQTINVIDQHSDLFELVGIAAGHKAKELKQIFVAMPKEYPDLVQMTTPSQQFGLEIV